jgi:hypothetical protein
MADSFLRAQTIKLEGLPPLQVRELLLEEQELAATGDMAGVLHRVITTEDGKPYFATTEAAKKFPLRLANELAEQIMALSDIEAVDDEGKL